MPYVLEKVECRNCTNGRVYHKVTCGSCGGSGIRNGFFGEKICSSCEGSGRVTEFKEKCKSCKGKGFKMEKEWKDEPRDYEQEERDAEEWRKENGYDNGNYD